MITTTRTSGSRSAFLTVSARARRSASLIAFMLSGRLSRSQATPLSTSYSRTDPTAASVISSPSLELAPALLEEGTHALLLILGGEQEVEVLALVSQPLAERGLQRLVDGFLGQPECQGRLGSQLSGQCHRHPKRGLVGHDPVDQAQLKGPPGADLASPEVDFHGHVLANRTRPALGATCARDDAQVALRLAEASIVTGD